MNRFALNRATLNGVTYALVLATANFAGAATVSARAIRQADALAPAASSAQLIADARVTRYVSANLSGVAGLYPQVTHVHASRSTLLASAEITAYVLRSVQAGSTVYGSANLMAIAASLLGQAQSVGSAMVAADATRVQAARSAVASTGALTLSAVPVAYRMALATVQGKATLRGETSIWQTSAPYTLHTGYGELAGAAEFSGQALATRTGRLGVDGVATVSSVANLRQPGRATANATSEVTALAMVHALCGSYIRMAEATLIAQATRVVRPSAVPLAGSGVFSGAALQQHAGHLAVNATADVAAAPYQIRYAQSVCGGSASATGTAVRSLNPSAEVAGTADLIAVAGRQVLPQSRLQGEAQCAVQAERLLLASVAVMARAEISAPASYVHRASAAMASQSSALALAKAVRIGLADLGGTAEVTAISTRLVLVTARVLPYQHVFNGTVINGAPLGFAWEKAMPDIAGTAELYVDTVANPESVDPPERTFSSPLRNTEFARSFIETEFRRAA